MGPDSFNNANKPGFGFLNVCSAIRLSVLVLGGPCIIGQAYYWVLGFITLLLEIKVMLQRKFATFLHGCQGDKHVKFAPSLFYNLVWGVLEG